MRKTLIISAIAFASMSHGAFAYEQGHYDGNGDGGYLPWDETVLDPELAKRKADSEAWIQTWKELEAKNAAKAALAAQEQNRLDMLKTASTPRGSLGR
jgi:hypothetical protein